MNDSQATWVVQSNKIKTSQTLPLIQALRRLGEPFVDVAVNTENGLLVPPNPALGKNLIPYGSTHLMKVAQAEGWQQLYFDDAKFRVDAWLSSHPAMLNADAQVMTLTEAKAIAHKRPQWFIRPLHDLKEFAGHVIGGSELAAWVTRLEFGDCEINGSCLVALTEPKSIQMEWRYFVVGGQIVTGSAYRFKGQPHQKRELEPDVLAEAQALADVWLPHPCCCMDVALCDGQTKVVEFNCLNASGFYDHDIDLFASAVSEYARRSL
jgi:ATP-grasp domain, R2K clade family 3